MKKTFISIGITLLLSSCYSVKKTVEKSQPNAQKIKWPEAYTPEESKFFVHNEIEINAAPEVVWDILIAAEKWEDYYDGANELVLMNNTTGKLEANTVFTWKTMGLDFESTIKEFEAPYRLSWESTKNSIQGYHAWLIIPTETGSILVTSEAQHGFMTIPQKIFVPKKLHGLHDEWLSEIKRIAESTTTSAK